MKNKLYWALIIFPLFILLTGCSSIGNKTTSMSVIYLVTTIFSLMTLVGYFLSIKKKDVWFIVLFISVFIVNAGYFLLSISNTLNNALWSNRISYLGSVFLPLSMIMIILNVSNLNYKKWIVGLLVSISAIVFLIAASGGYLDIYYSAVSLVKINGVSILNKEYGPWHNIYLFYLIGYFLIMVASIIYAIVKKKIEALGHAIILIVSVFVNICVWFLEQLVKIDFVSVSYIITELFLISVYLMIENHQTLIASLEEKSKTQSKQTSREIKTDSPEFIEHCKFITKQLEHLTLTEKAIYECYLKGKSTKEVLEEMSITENTLKFHNKNIYAKLGVSSRKQLLEYAKAIHSSSKIDE